MSPVKVLKDLMRGVLSTLKGTPVHREAYDELFKTLYDLLRLARREGLIALEPHVSNPHESDDLQQISADRQESPRVRIHLRRAVAGDRRHGDAGPVAGVLETEIHVIEEEHHAPLAALTKTADALPGFGIVAAVLGIVITMGAIDGPVEEIGHKVGAALVGTFLGILASYGFFGPLAARMEAWARPSWPSSARSPR